MAAPTAGQPAPLDSTQGTTFRDSADYPRAASFETKPSFKTSEMAMYVLAALS